MIYGCGKCRPYLEHREFELQCDNLALCWLLKRTREVGRQGSWILRLAPFKFKVTHTRVVDNKVADALSRMFEGTSVDTPEGTCAALWESLPRVYSSLAEHQKDDPLCKDLWERIQAGKGAADNFQVHKGLLCYCAERARRRRWVVPLSLKSMHLKYNGVLSGHLGARKNLTENLHEFLVAQDEGESFWLRSSVRAVAAREASSEYASWVAFGCSERRAHGKVIY